MLILYLNEDSRSLAAWKWFASVAQTSDEARTALYNVLALNPEDAWARQGLERLDARRSQTAASRPAPAQPRTRSRAASGLAVVLALAIVGLCLVAVALATFGSQLGGGVLPGNLVEGTSVPLPDGGGEAVPLQLPATWTPSATPTGLPSVTPAPTVTLTPVSTPVVLDPPPVGDFEHVESDSPLDLSEPVVESQSVITYPVSGSNAYEINQSILQNGPKGNGQDAIAQIEYGISLHYTLKQSPAVCEPNEAIAYLTMVFTYPEYNPPANVTQGLLDQWNDFLQRVHAHEETHAQIAHGCALETVTDFYALSAAPTCGQLQADIEAMQAANDESCDAQQIAFDLAEGGDSFP